MDAKYSKQIKRILQKIRMVICQTTQPSGQCQACLSDKSMGKDFMITCTICQSSIHNLHYGRQIDESQASLEYDLWKCERCRVILKLETQGKFTQIHKMQCQFCPSTRGILKRVIYNGNQTIWLHPECSTWPYPIIYQKNNRRIHYTRELPSKVTGKFWVNLEDQNKSQCQICNISDGYKIKCMYYTCHKYYHCSCAKSIGFIRDLESMQFQNCDTYIPPYCQEHLEQRINDCSVKASKYRTAGQQAKASNFSQMMSAYQVQLKNMKRSAQKHQEQEQIRKQMEYQAGQKDELVEELSFDSNQESIISNHPQSFYNYIFDGGNRQQQPMTNKKGSYLFTQINQSIKDYKQEEDRMIPQQPPHQQQVKEEVMKVDLFQYLQHRPRVQRQREESDIQQDQQWENSDEIQNDDE